MFKLYFPEDKSEYIPAIIELLIVILIVLLVMRIFKWISSKELKKAAIVVERMKALHEGTIDQNNQEDLQIEQEFEDKIDKHIDDDKENSK